MPCIPSVRDITILYPVGSTTMETIKKKKRQAYLARNSPTSVDFPEATHTARSNNIAMGYNAVININYTHTCCSHAQ